MNNWKTNLAAAAVFVIVGLYLLKKIDQEQLTTTIAVLVGVGFLASQDAKKTGNGN